MNLSFDQDVLGIDLPMLRSKFDPAELQLQLERAFRAIVTDPTHAGELDHQLTRYRSCKMHSALHPARGRNPDLRLVYRVEATSLYIVALRERPDVYHVATTGAKRRAANP